MCQVSGVSGLWRVGHSHGLQSRDPVFEEDSELSEDLVPKAFDREPESPVDRDRRNAHLRPIILQVFENNHSVNEGRYYYRQVSRKGLIVARCTFESLMRKMSLQGAVRS